MRWALSAWLLPVCGALGVPAGLGGCGAEGWVGVGRAAGHSTSEIRLGAPSGGGHGE